MNDYTVDIGGWIKTGWERYIANWGPLTGFAAIEMGVVILIVVPFVMVSAIVNLALTDIFGPNGAPKVANLIIMIPMYILLIPAGAFFTGGIIEGAMAIARGGSPSIGALFGAGKRHFVPMTGYLIITTALGSIPQFLDGVVGIFLHLLPSFETQMTALLIWALIQFALSIIIALFSLILVFGTFLIVDQDMGVIEALQRSASVYTRHYFMNTLFLILTGLIIGAGMILCCVGIFFTAPLGMTMLAVMYLSIFRRFQ